LHSILPDYEFSIIDFGLGRPLVSTDNTTIDHIVVIKPDYLYGPKVIDAILRKPGKIMVLFIEGYYFLTEFSFLIKHYNLLYQSLIPNCKLTIKLLKQHIEITSDAERFIVNGKSLRIRCQRIINLLLVQLNTTKDYKQFCYLFNMITIMADLSDKLRRGQLIKYCNNSNMYNLLLSIKI